MAILQQLNCLGHIGYVSGWTNTDYCALSCLVGERCRELTIEKLKKGEVEGINELEIIVERNRTEEISDRIEGVSRHEHCIQRKLSDGSSEDGAGERRSASSSTLNAQGRRDFS